STRHPTAASATAALYDALPIYPDELALAQRRLERLEVFRAARLEAAESIGADGLLPYDLIVQELPGRRFGVGASYSTVDGLGLEDRKSTRLNSSHVKSSYAGIC